MTRPAFSQERVFDRAKTLALSALLCLGRHTISGLLTTCGQQFSDWSSTYRLFEKNRVDVDQLFDVSRRRVTNMLPQQQPFVAGLDDTIIRKRGLHIAGTSFRRDPLGPKFRPNFVWAQRFLQVSAFVPSQNGELPSQARAIPINLVHCPTPRKPSKKASDEEWARYEEQAKDARISLRGAEQVRLLRQQLDADPNEKKRLLVMCVDGGYTNAAMLKNLPERTVLIGRIRKDAKLYNLPQEEPNRRGRKRSYGSRLPTPEQILKDDSIPWKTVKAFAAGRVFDIEYKSVGPVRWRSAGEERTLRLIVIRPLAYRPRKGAKLLYRDPAFLICSDPDFDEQSIIQEFLWRWEIEVNFREEKTLLGTGEAQVRTPSTVESVPGFMVAVYSYLLLADQDVGASIPDLAMPLWQRSVKKLKTRRSTPEMIGLLRSELWGKALHLDNYSGFVCNEAVEMKPENISCSLPFAVLYSHR